MIFADGHPFPDGIETEWGGGYYSSYEIRNVKGHKSSPQSWAWSRSRIRLALRFVVLSLLAFFSRRKPNGTVHLFFHAIPPEQASGFSTLLDRLASIAPVKSLEEALAATHSGSDEPAFTISFDDGFKSVLDVAGPILHARGIPSTVFVATALVGLSGPALERFTIDRLNWPHIQAAMTEDDIRSCATLGIDIGSHGVSHTSFAAMLAPHAEEELRESKETLEKLTGKPVRYFAWPFGARNDFPDSYIRMAFDTGYKGIFSGISRVRGQLPPGVEHRRELSLSWGVRICAYLAVRG